MQLSKAIIGYLDHCSFTRRLSPHTIRAYRSDLLGFCRFSAVSDIGALDKDILVAYFDSLTRERGLKAATVRRRAASIRAFAKWLLREGFLEENPMARIDLRIKLPRRLPRSLGTDQLAAVLRVARRRAFGSLSSYNTVVSFTGVTALVAVELMFATGIRVGELVALRLKDLDLDGGVLLIHGKGSRERTVYLPTTRLSALLRQYLGVRVTGVTTDTFLVTKQGRPASTQYIRELIRGLGECAGVTSRLTPHMFRHTAATQLLKSGVDIRVIQRLLGHQSITTTQIYAYVSDGHLKASLENAHRTMGLV